MCYSSSQMRLSCGTFTVGMSDVFNQSSLFPDQLYWAEVDCSVLNWTELDCSGLK